ncbi:nucleoid-associated protein [Stenotrophomonas acidaminiphila]|uniref:nucleoid-associated protein n=1 Tax=Stenotrophomonas acidaminiphila TaxID=128780 RepID=UPI0024AD3069|nr:nucleoid-associated protein [Stenotrophomonas acidaminiphila]WHL19020.1 nucleoid-associated protein [Stenotrophomonas acidaminiphila]
MQIIEATIHRLQKAIHTHGEGSVTTQLRANNLPIDETLEGVCRDLLALYNRTSDSSGTFGSNSNVHLFPVRLDEYLQGTLNFYDLSQATVDLIASQMASVRLANGGYALFLRYRVPPNDFLLIAMLKLKSGAGIDENSLGLLPTLNIDLDLLNEAARINITRLQINEEPYLTFIKGARKAAEVTEYFRHALACQNYTNAAEQTKQLILAADDFVRQREDLETEEQRQRERLDTRRRLFECLQQNRDEITLTTAAAAIYPAEPNEFIEFSQATIEGERKYKFDSRFKPDRKTTQNLRRISGSMGSVRVSFDVEDVRSGTVEYDAQRDAIIIKQPSNKLKQDILEHVDAPAD